MLRLPYAPPGEAGVIVKNFVNERLISLMEDVFVEHLVCMDTGREAPKSRDDYVAMLDEEKLDALRNDPLFADTIACDFAPDSSPKEKACSEFISLYKLLKVRNEHVPDLLMEYCLARLIDDKIEEAEVLNDLAADESFSFGEDAPSGMSSTVLRIPEPDRTTVLAALEEDAAEGESTAEDLIRYYEELEEYIETCFWDFDFRLLDVMSEEALTESPIAQEMGMEKRRDSVQVEVKIAGVLLAKGEAEVHPWDLEFRT